AEVLSPILGQVVPVVGRGLIRADDADIHTICRLIPLDPVRVAQAIGIDLPTNAWLAVEGVVLRDRSILVDPEHLAAQVLQVLRGALGVDQTRPVIVGQLVSLDEAGDRLYRDLLRGASAALTGITGGDEESAIRTPLEIARLVAAGRLGGYPQQHLFGRKIDHPI